MYWATDTFLVRNGKIVLQTYGPYMPVGNFLEAWSSFAARIQTTPHPPEFDLARFARAGYARRYQFSIIICGRFQPSNVADSRKHISPIIWPGGVDYARKYSRHISKKTCSRKDCRGTLCVTMRNQSRELPQCNWTPSTSNTKGNQNVLLPGSPHLTYQHRGPCSVLQGPPYWHSE